MSGPEHFNKKVFQSWIRGAVPVYKEQIPAAVFMALIGFVSSTAWITSPDSTIGKGASKLISSLLSGVGLLNVLFITTISILLIASVVRLIESDCDQSPASLIANCAVRGFSSFFIPVSALVGVLVMFMSFALNYSSPEKLKTLEINLKAILSMSFVGSLLFLLPLMILIVCSLPLLAKSKPAQYGSFICILGLWFIAFFDAIK